jgi:spore coat polysaccharide biosynthesis protein SpsF (cytidylyltransferase family)
LETYPCTWFFRVSADSPLLDASLFPQMLAHCTREDLDIVTNVFPRTFPKGHSLEMLHSATFASLQADELDANEQEHVTLTYYNHPERFRILNISSGNPNAANQSMVVDTLEDLRRLEASPQGDQVR